MTVEERRLGVGVLLPTRERLLSGENTIGPLLDLAEAAEEYGFDSVWAGDSPLARPRVEPFALLAAVAARTQRLTIGTAVLLAALRHPLLLAHAAATLDRVAQGRLVLAVGAGFPYPATEAEFAAVGVPFNERVGRLTEAVSICKQIWIAAQEEESEPISFSGRYYELDRVSVLPGPEQEGGPRFWLAGETEAAQRRAGSKFDGWLSYAPTPQLYRDRLAGVHAAARAADRTPPASCIYATVLADDDPDRARRGLDAYTQRYYGLPLEGMEQLQVFVGGPQEECATALAPYVDAGAEHLILRLGAIESHSRGIESLAEIAGSLRERAAHRRGLAP